MVVSKVKVKKLLSESTFSSSDVMGDLGIDQVLTMLIQEDQKQEQEIRRDRQRSLLMPKPLAVVAPDLVVCPHCNLPQ
jgi:hypothetical protein